MTATEIQIEINGLESQMEDLYNEIDAYISKYGDCTDPIKVNTIYRPHVNLIYGNWLNLKNKKEKYEKALKILSINKEDDDPDSQVNWDEVNRTCGKQITEDDAKKANFTPVEPL